MNVFWVPMFVWLIYGYGIMAVSAETAFDLLRLESSLNAEKDSIGPPEELCQKKCNDRLRIALDMVKAHTSFGSIGVPSVIDSGDLLLFCRFDAENDQCLRDCGYEIQFNMRDYVCKSRSEEMIANLACFSKASAMLKRQCGEHRCGPYAELELTLSGYASRCRNLICDLGCAESVLIRECGWPSGRRASRFLLDYTRVQVSNWMRDISSQFERPVSTLIPRSCSRLFCENFDLQNCTYVPAN